MKNKFFEKCTGSLRTATEVLADGHHGENAEWHLCAAVLPDADKTVLVFDASADEPCWPGFWDGEEWLWAEGASIDAPLLWREFPYPHPKLEAEARRLSKLMAGVKAPKKFCAGQVGREPSKKGVKTV